MSTWRFWLLFCLRFAELREYFYMTRAARCARTRQQIMYQLALLDEKEIT